MHNVGFKRCISSGWSNYLSHIAATLPALTVPYLVWMPYLKVLKKARNLGVTTGSELSIDGQVPNIPSMFK